MKRHFPPAPVTIRKTPIDRRINCDEIKKEDKKNTVNLWKLREWKERNVFKR